MALGSFLFLEGDGTTSSNAPDVLLSGSKFPVGFGINRSGIPTIAPTITVSASPDYSDGDVISGVLTLPSVVLEAGRPVRLASVCVKDKTGLAPYLRLLFFRATPAACTTTDNAAFVWGGTDFQALFIDSVDVLNAQYSVLAGKAWVSLGGLDVHHDATATSLFCVPTIGPGATWNAASTSDLIIEFHYEYR